MDTNNKTNEEQERPRCTLKEQETCQVEKMGCYGCYYNYNNKKENNK